jgi:hypothetical protein
MGIVVTVLVALLVAPGIVGATPLIANGGFETGDFTNWVLGGITTAETVVSGVGQVHSGTFAASSGAVRGIGSISQVIDTTPGTVYDISFWLADVAAPEGGPVTPSLFELWAGTQRIYQSIDFPVAFPYAPFTYSFLATATQTNVKFVFRHDPWAWRLDDVNVQAAPGVPEPLSLGLFGTGLLALGLLRRRNS